MTADTFTDSTNFLSSKGAASIPHPGGTLLEHLKRVAGLLRDWGASEDVQLAGLCHATYGTDGFAPHLLPLTDRAILAGVIGSPAEALVYLYASCDRAATYPTLAFRDRFADAPIDPSSEDLQAFLLITAANEIDVARHNAEIMAKHGKALYGFFARNEHLLPTIAWAAVAGTFKTT